MAGRINEQDIATVRERASIEEVVGTHVTLHRAGAGQLKGLCPFHDEKTPSFQVTPGRGFFYCFGCGEGGDVITFVQKIDQLGFSEAVQQLADKVGVQLRYEESGGAVTPTRDLRQRSRLLAAHKLAAEYYAAQLFESADAVVGRVFLHERGFDQAAAQRFGVGYAPRGGEALIAHLRGHDVSDDDLVTGGLAARGRNGLYDRFRGRLLWPIRDAGGDVIGFGARRLYDDDRVEAKYLNTPETPIYKKSKVLYGVDLARREIASRSQAVVVEGYTDVMACHLAGVPTAVATCGTAFGDEHARVLRHLLLDHDEFRGEVIFTFDGDEAGQRAAMKAYAGDAAFVGQTYVAVEPNGLDPCDVRQQHGEEAVRDLIASRVPLYRFVLTNVLARYDLDRADGRVDALRAAAPLVTSVRDRSKVDAYARELAGLLGMEFDEVRAEIHRAAGRASRRQAEAGPGEPVTSPVQAARIEKVPDPRLPRYAVEWEALKLVLQHPGLAGESAAALDDTDFTHPWLAEIWQAIDKIGGPSAPVAATPHGFVLAVREQLASAEANEAVVGLVAALAVEPLHLDRKVDPSVVAAYLSRVQELTVLRTIDELKSRLQRTNPVTAQEAYNTMFGELIALEQHRKTLRQAAIGGAI